MQQFIKILLYYSYLYEAQHVSDDTWPIIRSLKLHWRPLVFHTWKVVGRVAVDVVRHSVPDEFQFFWNDLPLFRREKLIIIHTRLGLCCRSILFTHRIPILFVCVCVCLCMCVCV
jgi:hypothetical protein